MKKIYIIACVLAAVSCTARYTEINSDPYGTTDQELQRDGYVVRSALSGIANGVISTDVNTTQFTECLLGGPMAGYLADANSNWANTISNYNPTDNWTNVLLKSDHIIPTIYTNYKMLHEVTTDPVLLAVGDIVKVAAMHRVTDTYGPIPYSKIGKDGKIQVEYDSQEAVYDKMFEELDAAIAVLTENRTANFAPLADVIYGGVTENWIRFANSLKLRLAMRISSASPSKAQHKAEEAVNHVVGVMETNSHNACLSTFGVDGNPINIAVKYNMAKHDDGSACTTGGDSHVAAEIACYMNGYSDPRREAYFTPSEWEGTEYVGLRHGIVIPQHSSVGHKYSGVKISTTDHLTWMRAAEVAFLKAEGAVKGWNMGGTAKDFYEQGVRLSFEEWGASGVDAYLADATSVPSTYLDPAGTNTYTSVISTITIAWDESASADLKTERIITQKWIANWLLGNESWADYRRTGYPRLIPASADGNKSGGVVDSERGARRMQYPRDEYVSNKANVEAAVANYLGGPDNMATDLWFARK